jgi:hypothetical protein
MKFDLKEERELTCEELGESASGGPTLACLGRKDEDSSRR